MTTQASPGLNIPSPYAQPVLPVAVGMFPPNSNNASPSTLAAVSSGALPLNVQISGPNVGVGAHLTNSLASVMSTAGADGSASATTTAGGSPNMGSPSNGPDGNPAVGGNPGAPPEQELNYPASALTGLTTPVFTG